MAAFTTLALLGLAASQGIQLARKLKNRGGQPDQPVTPLAPPEPPQAPNPYLAASLAASRARMRAGAPKTRTRPSTPQLARQAVMQPVIGGTTVGRAGLVGY